MPAPRHCRRAAHRGSEDARRPAPPHALRERQRACKRLARAAPDQRVEFAVYDQHRFHDPGERDRAERRRRNISGAAQVMRRVTVQDARGESRAAVSAECRRISGWLRQARRNASTPCSATRPRYSAIEKSSSPAAAASPVCPAGRPAPVPRRAPAGAARTRARLARPRQADERRGVEPQVIEQPAEIVRIGRAARRSFGKPEAAPVAADHAEGRGERQRLRFQASRSSVQPWMKTTAAPAPSSRKRTRASPDWKGGRAAACRFEYRKSSHSGYERPAGASSSAAVAFTAGRKARGRARARARRRSRGSPGAASRAARARSAPW